jgi:hypothetical protein
MDLLQKLMQDHRITEFGEIETTTEKEMERREQLLSELRAGLEAHVSTGQLAMPSRALVRVDRQHGHHLGGEQWHRVVDGAGGFPCGIPPNHNPSPDIFEMPSIRNDKGSATRKRTRPAPGVAGSVPLRCDRDRAGRGWSYRHSGRGGPVRSLRPRESFATRLRRREAW